MSETNGNGKPKPGGMGGLCETKRHARDDSMLVERAIKNGWPVSPDVRKHATERLEKLADSDDDRTAVRAIQTLIAADRLNVSREQMETPVQHEHSGVIDVEHRRAIILEAIDAEIARRGDKPAISGSNGNGNGKH